MAYPRRKYDLTVDRLKEAVDYDAETGVFRRRKRGKRTPVNGIIGRRPSGGYGMIKIDGVDYYPHVLAWLYVYGVWPTKEIDHRNNQKNDNRICNLREATSSQNKANTPLRKTNTSGFKGVWWHAQRKKWTARVQVNGVRKNLGLFATPEEASVAYQAAAKAAFGEFARFENGNEFQPKDQNPK